MPSATQRTQETQSRAGPSSPSTTRKRPSSDHSTAQFTYNPRQDATDRRKVRSDYRTLIAQAEESKRDSSLKPKDLVELISKVDELHERVVAPSESILDTKTLTSMSEMGARMAKKMKLNQDAFDVHEFMARVARYVGGEAAPVRRTATRDDSDDDDDDSSTGRSIDRWDWAKLGRLASTVSKRAVTMDFLLGPLEIAPKQRKAVTQRRQDDAPAERTAPRALQQHDLQHSAGRESTSAILKVAQLLAAQGEAGICLFRFAIDPHSFVNTIENFFHVSFLIKENKASLSTDADGNAILAAAQPPSEDDPADGEGEETRSKQFIMEIDYPTYLESIQLYDIRESVIPTRPNRVDALSGRAALAAVAGAASTR
ncbi:related to DNA repair protein Rad62 [Sporisorium reilianum f. sp. reilianum]|uniref:Non-structural maintenance of chromosomes element 4 n=1 Tax=Sporisorium reilianum f. sp. reilianum TaxID=72559 RepID=A0A2N8UH49_9BASI|nr:related to DNA repair protein Rad62 [Sporisorium reilianum f. sp. reilianum]